MKEIEFKHNTCLINENELIQSFDLVKEEIKNMHNALDYKYDDNRASINLPDDKETLKKIKELIDKKKMLKPEYIIVVGIGGSNLGTIAVQESILGKLYNQYTTKLKILYADTVDSDLINDVIKIIEPVFKKNGSIIINCVSKSGGTTETIANFEVLLNVLKKYKKDYQKYVVVTTDKDSKFWNLAKEEGFDTLEIPKKVGGRFSVFSPVGLFPLGLLDINIDELIDGALHIRNVCLNSDIFRNPAAMSAIILYIHYKKGINIHDTFLFSTDLESVGKWYRQLMGESLGKKYNKQNKEILNGMTPTVSIGSTDLHSMAQLYLGGPYDKFTTFIRVNENKSDIETPNFQKYSNLVENIQKIKIQKVMDSILQGVQQAFIKDKRPFVEICMPDKSAYLVGQLLQMKMMEIIYLGHLMNINPFNQPNVEDYKIETKKILQENRTNHLEVYNE